MTSYPKSAFRQAATSASKVHSGKHVDFIQEINIYRVYDDEEPICAKPQGRPIILLERPEPIPILFLEEKPMVFTRVYTKVSHGEVKTKVVNRVVMPPPRKIMPPQRKIDLGEE
jgi:hypothetical protein